jgi:hypothetical protein
VSLARTVVLVWCGAAALPAALASQGYRLRLETQAQAVSVRGVALDSILASQTVAGPGGGPETPDGFAVRCIGAAPYCTYFRPGLERRGGPFTTLASGSLWGIGVQGVSLHATARAGVALGDADVWPGTEPALHLLEGFAQYVSSRLTARLGRQSVATRLGTTGFDGARLVVHDDPRGIELGGFAGFGLPRGSALPVTSPALNPLDDFQPARRQLVAGLGAGLSARPLDLRLDYVREVDPRSDYFVSERLAVEGIARPLAGVTLSGGADYDLAAGWWGSAEVRADYTGRYGDAAAGVRRYRPHFELWTIWGAFSPVPYRAVHGRLAVRPLPWLRVRARAERYRFDDAEAETPLANVERDGWRWEVGGTVTPDPRWALDAGYHAEFGPGAAAAGIGGSIAFSPTPALRVALYASDLDRPLEFRFGDAGLLMYGIEVRARLSGRLRATVGASRIAEQRDRPDAAAFEWDQVRLAAGVAVDLGGGADGGALSVIRRLPGGRADR